MTNKELLSLCQTQCAQIRELREESASRLSSFEAMAKLAKAERDSNAEKINMLVKQNDDLQSELRKAVAERDNRPLESALAKAQNEIAELRFQNDRLLASAGHYATEVITIRWGKQT